VLCLIGPLELFILSWRVVSWWFFVSLVLVYNFSSFLKHLRRVRFLFWKRHELSPPIYTCPPGQPQPRLLIPVTLIIRCPCRHLYTCPDNGSPTGGRGASPDSGRGERAPPHPGREREGRKEGGGEPAGPITKIDTAGSHEPGTTHARPKREPPPQKGSDDPPEE